MNTLYITIKEGLLQYNEYIYERYSYNTTENIWNQQLRHNKKILGGYSYITMQEERKYCGKHKATTPRI